MQIALIGSGWWVDTMEFFYNYYYIKNLGGLAVACLLA
jgi:hypothetical protein